MGEPPVPRSTDEARATMDGCAVLQGSYLVNCNFHQIIQNCPHADSSLLPTERIARSDHSATEFSEAEDTTRQQQTRYVTPQNPTDPVSEDASSLLLPSLSVTPSSRQDPVSEEVSSLLSVSSALSSRQDSGVFSSLGSSLTSSDGHIVSRLEYHTYQPLYGMEFLCRKMAYSTHRVTLNKFGGVTFESVPSGIVTPIGNVTQLAVKLKTVHGSKKSSHHELHIGGWAIILPDDTEAQRWMSDLDDIPRALLDTKEYQGCQGSKGSDSKVPHSDSCHSVASQLTTTSKECTFPTLKRMWKTKEQQMYCALAPDVLLKYRLAEMINGNWSECSKCLEVSDHEVYDIQSWYTACVERAYTVLDIFHEQCGKKSRNFQKEVEKRLSCLPKFPELQRALNSTDHLCVRKLCPGALSLHKVHEAPSTAVCRIVSYDDAIAAEWTKLARLLGLSRSQIDRIRLEYHNCPQPCRQSATEVLSLWCTSGGTAPTCNLATLLKVLVHMGQDLVVSKVVEYLQSSTDS